MKSYALCPVSDKRIDERVARVNGFFTLLLLTIFGLTLNIIPMVFLAIDFFLRATDFSKFSLIGYTSKNIIRYIGLDENIINAGPKIFSARIGFIFSSLSILSFAINAWLPVIVLAGVLGLFSFLEAFLGYCVACEIYPFVYRFFYKERYS